ncbi:NACHT, LRR and PYD domains-containing protein 3-like isoform X1 [Rhincodon typus]|uniref:NACHT, LRR and PYD domains-containing protein 3-like isoform X1 n=1 Tax=Rhincodon typus TaxID=259920 RepID=UPI0020303441|nr:NACHT, LRR and PYD domains-containing protein 3-like isoform X1 [Rhincodon typus]
MRLRGSGPREAEENLSVKRLPVSAVRAQLLEGIKMEVSTELSPAQHGTASTVQDLETPVSVIPEVPEGSNSEEDPSPPKKMKLDTDSGSAVAECLKKCDDHQLFQLIKFYQDRLEQAIEEGTEGLSLMLKEKGYFSDQEHHKITELLEKGNQADSSKLLLNLVMEKGSQARRMMWEFFAKQCDEHPKLDKMLKEIEDLGSDSFDCMNIGRDLSEMPSQLKDAQVKHKEVLLEQTELLRVNSILKKEKVKIFQLVDHYAELSIICTPRDVQLVEHELLARSREHDVWREKHLRKEMTKIQPDQLFQANPASENKSGISSALSGVQGIGKTTMVQKIVYDWATEKMYQQFQFVFSFKFRDLNSINCKINLRDLILTFYPYFGNVLGELWKSPEGLLFIFDGLDEFNDSLNFDNPKMIEPQTFCADPEFQCEVSDIVCSLIQHSLLPGCSVLVTSRPTALYLLEKAGIGVWAEILGMVCDERKEYFNKIFEDQAVAAAVFRHLQENEILYPMSYNPSYCWILGLSLGPFFTQGDGTQQEIPKTITQLYSHYICNMLKSHGQQMENLRDVFLKLGEMAFAGISEKKGVFRNEDLIKYNLQPSQFLSGFLMDLLGRDESAQSAVHTFPHLTIQEFVAALAQFLTPEPKDIVKLLNEAQSKEGGRFEIFLRFVAGLSSPQSAQPLEEFLGPFLKQTTSRVTDWVKEKVNGQLVNTKNKIGKRNHMNTLHYLAESQNKVLAQSTVGSVETFKFCGLRLTPVDCVVLSHVIGLCNTIKHLNLENCFIQYEGLQRLGHILHKCRELRLGRNKLGDPGVKLLAAALMNQDCKIQKLELKSNALTDSCAEDLASALGTNQTLAILSLSNNKLGDSGVKLLSVALKNPDCKIQTLVLKNNSLTNSCTEDLASTLSTNRSLTDLILGGNKLGDSGVKLLSAALRSPDCKIQKLLLWDVGITDSCTEDLISALSANRILTDLNLGSNAFTDRSVPAFSQLIQTCRSLKWIWLGRNRFSPSKKRHLKLLQNSRPGLSVEV